MSDFEKGQIVEAHLAGASVPLTAQLFGVLRTTVFTFVIAYTKHGKTSLAKKNTGQQPKVNIKDCQTLRKIADITAAK